MSRSRPYLDERQRRLWLGVEAQALGSGGVAVIARATGADVEDGAPGHGRDRIGSRARREGTRSRRRAA